MTLTQLLIAALATWQAVEVWHHGGLVAGVRARLEARDDFVARLLTCPFCLSVWVGWAAGLFVWAEPTAVELAAPPPTSLLAMFRGLTALLVYGLAVARLANLANDLTRKWCRTPDRAPEEIPVAPNAAVR